MADQSHRSEDYIDRLMRFIEEMVSANTIQAKNSEDIKEIVLELKESNKISSDSNEVLAVKIQSLSDCASKKNCSSEIINKYDKTFTELDKVLTSEAYELSKMILSLRRFIVAVKYIVSALGLISLGFGIYKIVELVKLKGGN